MARESLIKQLQFLKRATDLNISTIMVIIYTHCYALKFSVSQFFSSFAKVGYLLSMKSVAISEALSRLELPFLCSSTYFHIGFCMWPM